MHSCTRPCLAADPQKDLKNELHPAQLCLLMDHHDTVQAHPETEVAQDQAMVARMVMVMAAQTATVAKKDLLRGKDLETGEGFQLDLGLIEAFR